MKEAWRTRLTWLAMGAVIAGVIYWNATKSDRDSVVRAIARGDVTYSLKPAGGDQAGEAAVGGAGDGGGGGEVVLQIGLKPGLQGDHHFVLPAGTLLGRAGSDTQRLMTAVPVSVTLTSSSPTLHRSIETYCLEPFKPPPTVDVDLEMGGDDPEYSTAQKLAACMKDDGPHGERQLAIWLVAHGDLDKDYSVVRQEMLPRVREALIRDVNHGLNGGLEAFLRKQFPGASDELIRAQVARLSSERTAGRLEAEATKVNDDFLKGFILSGPRLDKCGLESLKHRFFQTAHL